jgi:hypothetical protein
MKLIMDTNNEPTDIFLWANRTDSVKNDLTFELFVFNKNYTPYSIKYSPNLEAQLKTLFVLDIINQVNLGAGTGLSVRDYELSEAEDDVLLRTELTKVGRAETLIHLIDKPDKSVFYVTKAVQQSNVLQGAVSWQLNGGTFAAFEPEIGVKIPADNQVLILNQDIFIFNQSKFERLFQYSYKQQLLADKKVEEILAAYKLSLPENMDLQALVREKPGVVKKLQKLEVGNVKQEQVIDYADTMQLDLMTDDDSKIIIMDGRDLDMFVNLINEDYITSEITGKRYEIKSKKLLDEPDGEPPRG